MVEKSHTMGIWPSLYDPCVAETDIKVSLEDGVVTVRGEKQSSREEKEEIWPFSERESGAFSRSVRLPPDADARTVMADLKDGVLTVSVGKKAPSEAAGGSEIPIMPD